MAKKKLRDIIVTRVEIEVSPGETFEVRGISLSDIVTLSQTHMSTLSELFSNFMIRKGNEPVTNEMVSTFLVDCVADVPEIVSEIIALASDDHSPEAIDVIKTLRTPVLINAMMQIAALSITSEAELKKLVETLTKAIMKVTSLAGMLKNGMAADVAPVQEEAFRFPNGVSAPVRESIS